MIQLFVNPGDELPIYRQIVRQVSDGIAGGRVKPGERLPSHRELAAQLVIAPLTVKKAYDELEREGLVYSQRGKGLFVAERGTTSAQTHAQRTVRRAFDEGIRAARAAGMSPAQIREAFEAAIDHMGRQRP